MPDTQAEVQRIALGSKRVSEQVFGAARSALKDASAIRADANSRLITAG
jgi:hypothetical protein